jgi:hypothetical protein
MLDFITKRYASKNNPEEEHFLGNWLIDRASIVSMDLEIDLLADEYELIEDNFGDGLFILEGKRFAYKGNKLFPQNGDWKINQDFQLTVYCHEKQYVMELVAEQLVYSFYFDNLIGYKVYFSRF